MPRLQKCITLEFMNVTQITVVNILLAYSVYKHKKKKVYCQNTLIKDYV